MPPQPSDIVPPVAPRPGHTALVLLRRMAALEELTTSREEMQSMNEELQTVNNELRLKVAEISRASNDSSYGPSPRSLTTSARFTP